MRRRSERSTVAPTGASRRTVGAACFTPERPSCRLWRDGEVFGGAANAPPRGILEEATECRATGRSTSVRGLRAGRRART
jgi:hypothetical protein